MATSGSNDFIISTKDLIQDAYELCGSIGDGQVPTTAQFQKALRTLNMMTKTWQAKGLNLFAVDEVFLFLRQGQRKYNLTATTADHFTTTFSETTTAAAALAAATSIVLTDSTGIADGDFIGVKTDAGEILHWTTVADASGAPTIELTDALPADVSSGVTVYFYTAKASRPMKVMECYTTRFSGVGEGTDVPCRVMGRVDYGELANKNSSGVVNQVYQSPLVGDFELFVWPVTDSERDYLRMYVQRTLQDFDCLPNTPDYPQEWYMPLVYNLALSLAPKEGTPPRIYNEIKELAALYFDMAEGFDEENESSIFFRPDSWGNETYR